MMLPRHLESPCDSCGAPTPKQEVDWENGCPECGAAL